jgi:hypothetical protein
MIVNGSDYVLRHHRAPKARDPKTKTKTTKARVKWVTNFIFKHPWRPIAIQILDVVLRDHLFTEVHASLRDSAKQYEWTGQARGSPKGSLRFIKGQSDSDDEDSLNKLWNEPGELIEVPVQAVLKLLRETSDAWERWTQEPPSEGESMPPGDSAPQAGSSNSSHKPTESGGSPVRKRRRIGTE